MLRLHPSGAFSRRQANSREDETRVIVSTKSSQLTPAEAPLRIHKNALSRRPMRYQREDRVKGHIFVCFLTYILWKTLEQ